MSNYIDLHTHLLPGLDDGSADFEETKKIIKAAADAGFETLVATPHRIQGIYDASNQSIDREIQRLRVDWDGKAPCTILSGVEYYLDDRFATDLEKGLLFPLGNSKTLLVELPMMNMPPYAADYAFRMQLKGWTPLLAHPERYNDIVAKPKKAGELVRMGYLLQINLGSIAGMYGRRVAKTAKRLLDNDLVTVVASDIHSQKYCERIFGEGIERLEKIAGGRGLQRYLSTEPARLLSLDQKRAN